MGRVKRMERIVALTKYLIDHPHQLFSFSYFCKKFEIAKSTLSEDVLAVKNGLEIYGMGKVETLAGAAGGVRFIPWHSVENDMEFLEELAVKLSVADRILPGGLLYTTDLLCMPTIAVRLGEIIMRRMRHLEPDCIMTVETTGIPLALFVARAFNVPLVMARHKSQITEGSAVNINYVSGSSKMIQTMAMPKRALQPGNRVLIVDDFMKGGGTAKGMVSLAREVGAEVVGKAFMIVTAEPRQKMVDDYTALFMLNGVDEAEHKIYIEPVKETDTEKE